MTFDPIGATPRMLVPVTTTSSSVVSVAGAALAVVGPESWPNAKAAVSDVAAKSTILRPSCCMRKSPSDAGAIECLLRAISDIVSDLSDHAAQYRGMSTQAGRWNGRPGSQPSVLRWPRLAAIHE